MFGRVSVNTQLVVVLTDAFWCKLNKYNLSMVVLDNKTRLGNPEFRDWLNKVRNSGVQELANKLWVSWEKASQKY